MINYLTNHVIKSMSEIGIGRDQIGKTINIIVNVVDIIIVDINVDINLYNCHKK